MSTAVYLYLQIVGIDLICLAASRNGFHYILTATDLFSKFLYAVPLMTKTAEEVAKALKKMFYLYGPPLKVITDQEGSRFFIMARQ